MLTNVTLGSLGRCVFDTSLGGIGRENWEIAFVVIGSEAWWCGRVECGWRSSGYGWIAGWTWSFDLVVVEVVVSRDHWVASVVSVVIALVGFVHCSTHRDWLMMPEKRITMLDTAFEMKGSVCWAIVDACLLVPPLCTGIVAACLRQAAGREKDTCKTWIEVVAL